MSNKPSIRDGIARLSLEVCRMADSCRAHAKEHAIKALDGDKEAEKEARRYLSEANAYADTVKRIDGFRLQVERGDFSA